MRENLIEQMEAATTYELPFDVELKRARATLEKLRLGERRLVPRLTMEEASMADSLPFLLIDRREPWPCESIGK